MFTVLVEIVPAAIRSVCIGSFLFLMNNVGGNLPLLIDPLTKVVELVVKNCRTVLFCVQVPGVGLQTALYITWPGLTAASMFRRNNLLVNWTFISRRISVLPGRYSSVEQVEEGTKRKLPAVENSRQSYLSILNYI